MVPVIQQLTPVPQPSIALVEDDTANDVTDAELPVRRSQPLREVQSPQKRRRAAADAELVPPDADFNPPSPKVSLGFVSPGRRTCLTAFWVIWALPNGQSDTAQTSCVCSMRLIEDDNRGAGQRVRGRARCSEGEISLSSMVAPQVGARGLQYVCLPWLLAKETQKTRHALTNGVRGASHRQRPRKPAKAKGAAAYEEDLDLEDGAAAGPSNKQAC